MKNLYELFSELPSFFSQGDFKAIKVGSRSADFLAKGNGSAPVFLIRDLNVAKYTPGIEFKHMSASFHVTCRVLVDDSETEGQFCLLQCDPATPDLHEIFIGAVSAAVERLPEKTTTQEISSLISEMQDLFRSLSRPSFKEVTGLWAELYVILHSKNSKTALELWHDDPFDRVDFYRQQLSVEVKATTRSNRIHEFSLDQINAASGGSGYVVSMMLQPLSNGLGILDLVDKIETLVTDEPKLRGKLWKNLITTLGSDFSESLDRRFDVGFAKQNLRVYKMSEIPAPGPVFDPRVSSIHFSSDLTAVQPELKGSPFDNLVMCFAGTNL